jgi:hypothetical protein
MSTLRASRSARPSSSARRARYAVAVAAVACAAIGLAGCNAKKAQPEATPDPATYDRVVGLFYAGLGALDSGVQNELAAAIFTTMTQLVPAEPATQIQARVLLYGAPVLQRLALALSGPGDAPMAMPAPAPAELPVPPRAQLDYPNGPNICSPTALAMVLAYWHARTGDARLAPFAERRAVAELTTPQVYDPLYEGHGNWGFNTAYAGSLGLDAYVARFGGMAELVQWLAAGVPVVISVAWQPGELANAPIASSRGHLLIVAGFDRHGQVIVADPRGEREAEVRRIYDAGQLERAWQHNSAGTAYLIHPRGWSVPAL